MAEGQHALSHLHPKPTTKCMMSLRKAQPLRIPRLRMASWHGGTDGHWITRPSHRIPEANPFQQVLAPQASSSPPSLKPTAPQSWKTEAATMSLSIRRRLCARSMG